MQALIGWEPAQNTTRTHEQVYVLRYPATRPEAEQVTGQGLTDAVGHAREVMQMRMLLDAGAGQLTDYTGSPQQAQALAGGSLDTATGACLDFTTARSVRRASRAPLRSWTAWPAATRSPPAGTCPAWTGCTAP